jgi:hypothetical protein
LPKSPFLGLNTDGASRLTDFSNKWLATAADGQSAISTIQNRTTGGWLANLANGGSGFTSDQLTQALVYINDFKAGMTGPIGNVSTSNDNGDTATLTFNISAWTGGSPPKSLAAFFPSLQSTGFDGFGYTLIPVANSISDITYGGLIPAGITSLLLYDRFIYLDDNRSVGTVAGEAFTFWGN